MIVGPQHQLNRSQQGNANISPSLSLSKESDNNVGTILVDLVAAYDTHSQDLYQKRRHDSAQQYRYKRRSTNLSSTNTNTFYILKLQTKPFQQYWHYQQIQVLPSWFILQNIPNHPISNIP